MVNFRFTLEFWYRFTLSQESSFGTALIVVLFLSPLFPVGTDFVLTVDLPNQSGKSPGIQTKYVLLLLISKMKEGAK